MIQSLWPSSYSLSISNSPGRDIQGQTRLADRLLSWFRHWNVVYLVADESGVGAGLVDWLAAKLGRDRVEGYKFSPPNKAALGSKFLSTIETVRFKYWLNDKPLSDSWWFFRPAEHCIFHLPPGGLFEKHLKWYVPDSDKISTPKGRPKIHDDRLISAALVSIFDDLHRAGRLNIGLAKSAIVPPVDPLSDLTF